MPAKNSVDEEPTMVSDQTINTMPRPVIHTHRHNLRHRFEMLETIGEGTYGKVKLAIEKSTGEKVAMKYIKLSKIKHKQDLIKIRREIKIMSILNHPHIINVREVFENKEKIIMVMDYAAGGELYDYVNQNKPLPEREARKMFRQIVSAICYCHQNGVVHRDLKLENILLDWDNNVKVADFGLSNFFSTSSALNTFCGSPLYTSPEIINGVPYRGPEADCWSLGVVLYTLVYGNMPFNGHDFKVLKKQISTGDYYEPTKSSSAAGLIRHLLTVNPERRASMEKIVQHWWVNMGHSVTPHNEPYPGPWLLTPIHVRDRSSMSSDSDGEIDINEMQRRGSFPSKTLLSRPRLERRGDNDSRSKSTLDLTIITSDITFQSPRHTTTTNTTSTSFQRQNNNTTITTTSIGSMNINNGNSSSSNNNNGASNEFYRRVNLDQKPVRSILKQTAFREDSTSYRVFESQCKENSNPNSHGFNNTTTCSSFQNSLPKHSSLASNNSLSINCSTSVPSAPNRDSVNILSGKTERNPLVSANIPSSDDIYLALSNNKREFHNTAHSEYNDSGSNPLEDTTYSIAVHPIKITSVVQRRGILKKTGHCCNINNNNNSYSSMSSDARKRLSIGSVSSNSSGDLLDFSYDSCEGEQHHLLQKLSGSHSPLNGTTNLAELDEERPLDTADFSRRSPLPIPIQIPIVMTTTPTPSSSTTGAQKQRKHPSSTTTATAHFNLEYDLLNSSQVCRRALEICQNS
ncbi:NUAK family SNF1-like kinase 1 isoform X1 [Argonauta hians]